ncbi:hypothetical protein ACHMW6_25260 [Pseudoduganella sp. UC29_106]|uniref:hypothetical protein n=1 Tax=Pseudoduganella sp. UC29_106 TaxID=3374553 RepID=UPI0037581B6C
MLRITFGTVRRRPGRVRPARHAVNRMMDWRGTLSQTCTAGHGGHRTSLQRECCDQNPEQVTEKYAHIRAEMVQQSFE